MLTWLIAGALCFQNDQTVFVDRVAIKVNDKMMTERELALEYRMRRDAILKNFTGAELDRKLREAWTNTVQEAEENMLLYEHAVEIGYAYTDDDALSRLMAIKESNGMSDEELEQAIRAQTGMTLNEFIDYRKRSDSAQATIQREIISKIQIDDSEIAKFYDERKSEYMNPETYRIAEIVFLKEEKDPASVQAQIRTCLDFLDQGGDFAEAARQFSDSSSKEQGGDLGVSQFGDLRAVLEDEVRKLEIGGRSGLLETPFANFIIKLLDRTQAEPKPLAEVREDIIARLRGPRTKTRLASFLEELKGKYLLQTYVKEPPFYLDL